MTTTKNKKTKEIDSKEFAELAKSKTRNVVAKHFNISDMTAQRLANQLGITFKEYRPTGRKKIEFIKE